jgi:hypothetical protein
MGFTNVAWESRGAEQLARDLTTGPGPTSVGQAGAAWARVAREWAGIAEDYNKIVDKIKGSFASNGATAAAHKLDEFGRWLQSASLAAADNGERAERAAVAYSVAVLEMPSVSEALEAKTAQDVMASLAAYNGAVLNGRFAELDNAVAAHQVNASAAMYTYEDACNSMAVPWDQPVAPEGKDGAARHADQGEDRATAGGAGAMAGGVGPAFVAPAPLGSFRADEVDSSKKAPTLRGAGTASATTAAAVGPAGGYGPLAGLGRGGNGRDYQSGGSAASLDGGGETGAGLSQQDSPWLPAAQPSDAPFTVSHVSWSPDAPTLDGPVAPVEPEPAAYADTAPPTLEQVSNRWVAPPMIGADKELTL